ncbi:MAG: MFS transporter [Acetobacteraceae bacterium]|nr:MFS transporter [Acetobacteraceae bacterium]
MLAAPGFWLLYAMFTLISASGLMATAQLAPIARSYGVADTVLLFGASTLTVALIFDNLMNGAARPFFGWISDRIGREPTMTIAFGLGGISYWLLGFAGSNPWLFTLGAGAIFFTWGEIFSLFPSTCTDMFGTRFAATNSALLYTAKGVSAWLVPLTNFLTNGNDWHRVFMVTATTNWLVALIALVLLPRVRKAQLSRNLRHARVTELIGR